MSPKESRSSLKQRLLAGETLVGCFSKLTDPAVAEIAGLAGMDFIILDQEHGAVSSERLQDLIRACECGGIAPVVRLLNKDETLILRALDSGSEGVQVPQVCTVDDAEMLAKASRFHPLGNRGVCRYVRAAGYGSIPSEEHFSASNSRVLTIAHIEGLEGIANLGKICSVSGVDVLFIGPYDLSQSCGVPGQVDHPAVERRMAEAVAIARSNGLTVGTFVESVESARKWISVGVRYLAYSVDVALLFAQFRSVVKSLKTGFD